MTEVESVQEQPEGDVLGVDYVEGDYLRPGERYEDDELSPDAEMREATERVLDFSGRSEPREDEYAGSVLLGRSFVRSSEKKSTDWLFEPLFIAKHQHYVVGEKESNKSMLMLWVAVQFALNNDWGGQVLYLDEENDPGDIQDRLTDFGLTDEQWERLNGRLQYVHFPSLRLNTPGGAQVVLNTVDAHAADMVVIDTVSKFVEGPEESSDTYKRLYHHLLVELKKRDVASMILDHPGHSHRDRPRGTSAKVADVDSAWIMRKTKESNGVTDITLAVAKDRSGRLPRKVYLRKLLNPLRFEVSETPFELAAPAGAEDNETKALRLLREHFTTPVGVNEGCRFLSGHGVSMRTEKLKHLVRAFNEGLSGSAQ
ncbi:AAA family ATPase [Mycobacteroides abscessus]|uniref:AAA family ATPase n=1 Tax=Mycobacteroides abscessus TaxID=36809 RepID=UPI001F48380C|nr:AAA family ATPase [Mycobacteroides abscessus]